MDQTRRTIILLCAILLALVFVIILFVVLGRRGQNDPSDSETPEYFHRELMIDEIEYRMPDPAAALLEPRLEYVVDPDSPFPEETARDLEEDALSSLNETLLSDLESQIEELIRESR